MNLYTYGLFPDVFAHVLDQNKINTQADIIPIITIIDAFNKVIREKIEKLKIFSLKKESFDSDETFTVQLHNGGLQAGVKADWICESCFDPESENCDLPFFNKVNLVNTFFYKGKTIPVIVQMLNNGHLVLFDCRIIMEYEGIPCSGARLCKPLIVVDKDESQTKSLTNLGTIFSIITKSKPPIAFEVVECADDKSKYQSYYILDRMFKADENHFKAVSQTLCGGFFSKEIKKREPIKFDTWNISKVIYSSIQSFKKLCTTLLSYNKKKIIEIYIPCGLTALVCYLIINDYHKI